MARRDVQSRTPFASPPAPGASPVRHPVAGRPGGLARLLLVPFAAAAAAIAGLVYLVLLPICGIASIAGAVAQASWGLLREAFGRARPRAAPPG